MYLINLNQKTWSPYLEQVSIMGDITILEVIKKIKKGGRDQLVEVVHVHQKGVITPRIIKKPNCLRGSLREPQVKEQ